MNNFLHVSIIPFSNKQIVTLLFESNRRRFNIPSINLCRKVAPKIIWNFGKPFQTTKTKLWLQYYQILCIFKTYLTTFRFFPFWVLWIFAQENWLPLVLKTICVCSCMSIFSKMFSSFMLSFIWYFSIINFSSFLQAKTYFQCTALCVVRRNNFCFLLKFSASGHIELLAAVPKA